MLAIDILKAKEPEGIFTSPEKVREEYRNLAREWHPDRNKDKNATDVLAHINILYESALKKIDSGTWTVPGLINFVDVKGKKYQVRYKKHHTFELGEIYYGEKALVFTVKTEFADLFHNGRQTIKNLKYQNAAMKEEFERFFPKVITTFETHTHCVMVCEKTEDVFMLSDVKDHFDGKIDPKHIAWMQTRLHNIACYLEWAKLTHNDISPMTVFVSPEHHTILLLGGWWWAAPVGAKLTALPSRTHRFTPPDILRNKQADTRVDLTLNRIMGRDLAGDITGLNMSPDLPVPMKNYFRFPTTGSAKADYKALDKVLHDSFGARRFVKMEVTKNDIFNK